MFKNNQEDLTTSRAEDSPNSYDLTPMISSENSDTWTLVTDTKLKQNESTAPKQKIKEQFEKAAAKEEENRIEVIEANDHQAKKAAKDEEKSVNNKPNAKSKEEEQEDLSDGISIISECESVESHPPHSEDIQHCNCRYKDINGSFSPPDNLPRTPSVLHLQQNADNQILRQRHRNASASVETSLQPTSQAIVDSSNVILILKRKLKILFYTAVFLSILAIIGKVYYPAWQSNSQDASAANLEQKLNDISLQNNLMRAEIDILNKQVKYLTTFTDQQQNKRTDGGKHRRNSNPKKQRLNPENQNEDHFKAWQGIGDTLQPVEITKNDLRRPYRCSDGSFVEFAGMCIEQKPHEPSISEQFANVVDDLKKESKAWQTFEKIANHLHEFKEKPHETIEKLQNDYGARNEFASSNTDHIPDQQRQTGMSAYEYRDNHYNDNYGNHKMKDTRKEIRKESKKFSGNPTNEKYTQYEDNFKERKYHKNERENNNKHYNYKEEENYEYNNNKKFQNKGKDKDKDKHKSKYHHASNEDWQENYMKNREQARLRNGQKFQDDNWYIKRGEGREHKRYSDDR